MVLNHGLYFIITNIVILLGYVLKKYRIYDGL